MNEKDWRILKILAEEKNITTAAERLYITQPALTYRLKTMEKELGTTLFVRMPRGLIITPQGEEFLRYADSILRDFERTKRKVTLMDGNVSGRLKLAVSPAFARYKLAKVLSGFRSKYPHIEFSIKTCTSTSAMSFLESDDVHVAIVRGEHKWAEEKVLLTEEPIVLIAHDEISMSNLPNLPYIVYETDSTLKKEISDWWRECYSVPPKEIMYINDSDTCRQMIALGLGFSILPAIDLRTDKYPDLLVRPLEHKNGAPLKRSTWLSYRAYSTEIPVVAAFTEYLKKFKFV